MSNKCRVSIISYINVIIILSYINVIIISYMNGTPMNVVAFICLHLSSSDAI